MPGDPADFRFRGLEKLEAFLSSEPRDAIRSLLLDFVFALLSDPRTDLGVLVPGGHLNEVCRILPGADVALTWTVVWGEKVIWLHKVERL